MKVTCCKVTCCKKCKYFNRIPNGYFGVADDIVCDHPLAQTDANTFIETDFEFYQKNFDYRIHVNPACPLPSRSSC